MSKKSFFLLLRGPVAMLTESQDEKKRNYDCLIENIL